MGAVRSMPPPEGAARRAGMTLVEVLVASIILGVGVAGLLSVATLALRNQQRVEHRATALAMAQERLAEIERDGAASWTAGRATEGTQEQGGVNYAWDVSAESLEVGELYDVRVTVTWTAPGSTGQVELQTWLNDYSGLEAAGPAVTKQAGEVVPKQ